MKFETRQELIKEYIEFFKKKDHREIPSSSLIPENDPTVLFTTAGMHPLVPFLLGQKHPLGKRLVDVQKCIRTGDIDEVGDSCHHTFFEMLGNWSLGDYFKKEAIEFSFEFLTKEIKIPLKKLAVTCFEGDKDSEKDNESSNIWINLGMPKERIAFLPKKNNWWGPAGETGPCGPDTEMFYWKSDKPVPIKFNPEDDNWVEIWNDVFMQYNKTKDGKYLPLTQRNVDTGMGVERTLTIFNNLEDNYKSPIFLPIIKEIEKLSKKVFGKEIFSA
jgi:alanyl-tRNA synthetase